MIWKDQIGVLMEMANLPPSATQKELAEAMGLKQPALSRVLNRELTKLESFLMNDVYERYFNDGFSAGVESTTDQMKEFLSFLESKK